MDAQTTKPKLLHKENYLAMIEGSVGSEMFRHLYADVGGETVDLTKDGQVSCALFVSSILHHFKLIGDLHATVGSTAADMLRHGWRETPELVVGCVVEWEPIVQADGESHGHVGFYMGADMAISHSDRTLSPARHALGMTDEKPRKIVKMYTHALLG